MRALLAGASYLLAQRVFQTPHCTTGYPASPCLWSDFNSFFFVSNPNQDKYAGLVWAGFARVCNSLINILGWFG